MALTKIGSIIVANLKTTSKFVDHLLVEIYSDAGLTNKVGSATAKTVWDGSTYSKQAAPITFAGLAYGNTFYLRAGVVTPVSGSIAWSGTYSVAVGSASAPNPTYTISYDATTSGITYTITPSSVPSDLNHYEVFWNMTGTAPSATQVPNWKGNVNSAGSFVVFVGHKPGQTVYVWVRAVSTSMLVQTWVSLLSQVVKYIDPSSTDVLTKGSIPPSLANSMTYSSTTSEIDWSWLQNQFIFRADNTQVNIPTGSEDVTGLTSGTTYYFYPYYDEPSSTMKWLDASSASIPNLTGVLLNGTTGYISTPNSLNLGASGNPYSVDVWIRTTAATAQGIMDASSPSTIGTGTGTAFQIVMNASGTITASVWAGGGTPAVKSCTTSKKYNDGSYHHVAMSWDTTNTLTLYVDGQQAAQNTATGAGNAVTGVFIHIGAVQGNSGWTATSNLFFNGSISHASFYNEKSISLADSLNRFQSAVNSGQSLLESVLTTYNGGQTNYVWFLTDTSGTTAADATTANNGTYVGGCTLNQSYATCVPLGTPAVAWPFQTFRASQGQALQNRIPLSNGALSAATTSAGTGGGTTGGAGGGYGGCFSRNTRVKTKRGDIPISDVEVGDLVLTAAGTWKRVKNVFQHPVHEGDRLLPPEPGISPRVKSRSEAGAWLMHDMGDEELITLNHSLLHSGWKRAHEAYKGHPVVEHWDTVFNIEVDAEHGDPMSETTESSFTLSNGIVVHNLMMVTK